jgi:hypothetical protein
MHEPRDPGPTPDGVPNDATDESPRAKYPWADDYFWLTTEREKPGQGVLGLYEGLWVVVYNRQVVGAVGSSDGSKPVTQRVAEFYGVPENRLVFVRVDSPDDPIFTR